MPTPTPATLGDIVCLCGHKGCEHYAVIATDAPPPEEAALRCRRCSCESMRHDAGVYSRVPGISVRILVPPKEG